MLPHKQKAKKSASATARTDRRKAVSKGQCALSMVGKVICICLMLMFIASASNEILKKFHARQVGIYSEQKNAKACHQGRAKQKTSNKLSTSAYSKYNTLNFANVRINACNMQCKEIAQKGEEGRKQFAQRAKSQKPETPTGKW